MKKLLYIILFCTLNFVIKAQVTPVTGGQPLTQSIASDSAFLNIKGIAGGRLVIYRYADTTAANLHPHLKNYPFALLGTTSDGLTWYRSEDATRWINTASGGGDSYTFINDSTLIICSPTACDTITLGNSNTYYYLNDSTIVTCDTLETICVGDSCYQQQICDTIPVPKITSLLFQNGVQKYSSPIVEHGWNNDGNSPGQLIHDTYLFTQTYKYTISGAPLGSPLFNARQDQLTSENGAIIGINGRGSYSPNLGLLANNDVNLYFNYTDRYQVMTQGTLAGDTIGLFGENQGYLLQTNARASRYSVEVNNTSVKQVGIFFPTDSINNDGVTIFGQQTPSSYYLSINPPTNTTFYDERIAVFKTDKSIQFNGYGQGTFTGTPTYTLKVDADGNLIEDASSSGLTAANNGLSVATSTVQLGNTVGGTSAALISNREIPMANFTINIKADAAQTNNLFAFKNTSGNVRASITAAADFSNTGGQTNGEKFGSGAVVGGSGSTAFGKTAVSGAGNDVVIGYNSATGAGGTNVSIGANAIISGGVAGVVNIGSNTTASSNSSTVIGSNSSITGRVTLVGASATGSGSNSTGLGEQVSITHNYAVALGFKATTTAASQFVVGTATAGGDEGTHHFFLGNGVVNVSSGIISDIDIQPTGAFGSNQSGVDFYINGAKRTGNATGGGDIRFQTSDAGSSGSTLQSLTTKAMLSNSIFAIGRTSSFGATRLDVVDNAVGANNIVNISSTSTAAASNLQKGLNVSLSGANATGSQSTYSIYSSNTHTGTSSSNYGGYFTSSGGATNYGVYTTGSEFGLYAVTSSGTAVVGTSTSSYAFVGQTTSGTTMQLASSPSGTNSVNTSIELLRNTSGTAAAGIGTQITYTLQMDDGDYQPANKLISYYTNAGASTRTSSFVVWGVNSGSGGNKFIVNGDGSLQIIPITATAASAITPSEGLLVFVSNTNGTFNSIGIWCYQNGAWKAL